MVAKFGSTPGNEADDVAVVMVPLPAQGHLNQLLHLSRLISAQGIPVHYVGSSAYIHQATTRVHGWDPLKATSLHFHELPTPPAEFQSPPAPVPDTTTKFPSQLMPAFLATEHLRRPLTDLVGEMAISKRKVVVIADSFMGWVVQDLPSVVPKAEVYRFRCLSAFCSGSYIWEAAGKPEIGPGSEILNFLPSREGTVSPEFDEFVKVQSGCWVLSSGDILNSSREIEAPFIDFLATVSNRSQFAIGPFNPISLSSSIDGKNRHRCLKWLDGQEKDSVLFVSFGTTTSLSGDQITELAIGLEQSMQKFIWVLRDGDGREAINGGNVVRPELPEGYEERTRERGLVVRDWAPQLEILGHASTGGFLSHCGWNSCMESISMGVPVAAWPVHSDQPRNAALLTRGLGIGISLMDWERRGEVVGREEVAEGVKKLMASKDGEEMRRNAVKVSESVKKSVTSGGGRDEFQALIAQITR
ncbi:unnamed protein product [Cuscuta epithymum]|uniref:Glycosyltransferase n=1 Tax=Cuscuta epithymum TaxID=186058 RepID=A0AAV0EWU4_9ASTE|nr:unnamed protein product [Cuscuta epithymum]